MSRFPNNRKSIHKQHRALQNIVEEKRKTKSTHAHCTFYIHIPSVAMSRFPNNRKSIHKQHRALQNIVEEKRKTKSTHAHPTINPHSPIHTPTINPHSPIHTPTINPHSPIHTPASMAEKILKCLNMYRGKVWQVIDVPMILHLPQCAGTC
jgi:hypothetical protein